MTLAFGLFAASVAGRLSGYFNEVPVDLPKTVSDSPIIVVPEGERHLIGHREFFGNLW